MTHLEANPKYHEGCLTHMMKPETAPRDITTEAAISRVVCCFISGKRYTIIVLPKAVNVNVAQVIRVWHLRGLGSIEVAHSQACWYCERRTDTLKSA